jgi:hypothetical protein
MDRLNQLRLLSELKEKISDYQNQVELNVIEKTSFIVQVGALTVTIDSDGIVKTQNICYPTQFTQKAVNEILTISFRNGKGEKIFPKIYLRVNWYFEKLTELKETYNHIDSIFNTNND